MRRYAVPIVLLAWATALEAGCDWQLPWVVLVAFAAVLQALEHASTYRRRW